MQRLCGAWEKSKKEELEEASEVGQSERQRVEIRLRRLAEARLREPYISQGKECVCEIHACSHSHRPDTLAGVLSVCFLARDPGVSHCPPPSLPAAQDLEKKLYFSILQ